MSPATRESAVAAEKIAVAHARRRLRSPLSSATLRRAYERDLLEPFATMAAARAAGLFTYGEHQAAEEARPDCRPRADGEPALPLDREDVDAAPRAGRR